MDPEPSTVLSDPKRKMPTMQTMKNVPIVETTNSTQFMINWDIKDKTCQTF